MFALNADVVNMPRPFMTKVMASTPVKRSKKAKAALAVLGEATRRMNLDPQPHFSGLDKAAQAGLILRQLEKLEPQETLVLRGLLTRPYDPCSCRSPCCSGQRKNPRWIDAVEKTCDFLRDHAEVLRQPGRKGLSTQPNLRQALVENWYTGDRVSMPVIAKHCDVTAVTARAHWAWITDYLVATENSAWTNIAPILDEAGITGAFL